MCVQWVHYNLCKNEWCPNPAARGLVNQDWKEPCNDKNNYTKACDNYRKEDKKDYTTHSNHYYCTRCKSLGYVDT